MLLSLLCFSPLSLAQQQKDPIDLAKETPDGSLVFSAESVQLIIGGSRGEGVLTYKGKDYPFKFKGASAGAALGLAKSVGSGNVYRLKNIEDFPGVFTNASTGITVGAGVGTAVLQNNNGVVLHVKQKSKGGSINLSAGGVDVSFE
ncbi:MAG: DUF1134 domain-containing protein [Gammaproteobacteria bacterium]